MTVKVVFMGTPDFAVPSLHALVDLGYTIQCVVTPAGSPERKRAEDNAAACQSGSPSPSDCPCGNLTKSHETRP